MNKLFGENNVKNVIWIFVVFLFIGVCSAVPQSFQYLPQNTIELSLPHTKEVVNVLRNIPLTKIVLKTIPPDNNVDFHYIPINVTAKDAFDLNRATGELKLADRYNESDVALSFSVATSIQTNSLAVQPKSSIFSFKINKLQIHNLSEYCQLNVENRCFWDRVHYAIPENMVNKKIGEFISEGVRSLCPYEEFVYNLLNGTEYVRIKGNALYTLAGMDHDTLDPGPKLHVHVQCEVLNLITNLLSITGRVLEINVIDRNDNLPELQDEHDRMVMLNDPHFRQNESINTDNLIFLDIDSDVVNSNIYYEILNDTDQIFGYKCNGYVADHNHGLQSSVFNCKIIFRRSGILSYIPYCIQFAAKDNTTEDIQKNAITAKKSTANVCLIIQHSGIEYPTALSLKKVTKVKPSDLLYETVVHVPRNAKKFHRVTTAKQFKEIGHLEFKFNLTDPSNAFAITYDDGILYVNDEKALAKAKKKFNVIIRWGNYLTHRLQTYVIDPLVTICTTNLTNKTQLKICAEASTQNECEQACGIGVTLPNQKCEWRPGDSEGKLSSNYATCSSNLQYCPDNFCDSLENLTQNEHLFSCPQDCADPEHIYGPHTSNSKGIRAATGLCTCDIFGMCACATHELSANTPTKPKKNKPTTKTNDTDFKVSSESLEDRKSKHSNFFTNVQCDLLCFSGIFAGALIFIVSCTNLMICICRKNDRHDKLTESKNENYPLSDKLNGEGKTDTEIQLAEFLKDFYFDNEVDSKWEFPVDQLTFDKVLGEGEFGKVVKGYATNIDNEIGITTIAVKMLKPNAHSVEHYALLSEFKLLQDVCHPNVIRLLGACTKNHQTPMIIIEYAKYGSLRNYLRLSRKVEMKLEFADNQELNDITPVTVHDVLSFAWQISKGMAYLADMKLIHRDLAARNVLLAGGKLCKISDFGLTRDVYEDDAYLKQSKDRVPVKWMAPESLADHVYTTRSDVWSFGVLAWEIITLGASPYPGIPPQNLYHLLKSGYRMEKPENCSDKVYSIISACWTDDPYSRPSFKELVMQWEYLLGINVEYINMETGKSDGISNPLYCQNMVDEISEKTMKENSNLESLWHPPSNYISCESDANASQEGTLNSTATSCTTLPMGYDIPRSMNGTNGNIKFDPRYKNTDGFASIQSPIIQTKDEHQNSITSNIYDAIKIPHYTVPIKRVSIDDNVNNLNGDDKKMDKNISMRLPNTLNITESQL